MYAGIHQFLLEIEYRGMTMKRNNSIKKMKIYSVEEEIGGDLWKQANEASQK